MLCHVDLQVCSKWGTFRALVWGSTVAAPAVCRPRLQFIWCFLSPPHRMYRRTSNMVGLSYPPTVISVLKVLTLSRVCPCRSTDRSEQRCVCLCVRAHVYLNSPLCPQNVDKWSFDVFALNEASGDHALKFIFYELLTRYDLISRFKVSNNAGYAGLRSLFSVSFWQTLPNLITLKSLQRGWFDASDCHSPPATLVQDCVCVCCNLTA